MLLFWVNRHREFPSYYIFRAELGVMFFNLYSTHGILFSLSLLFLREEGYQIRIKFYISI